MKIKNLAFFGVMAAIMGVANAARADATTVIASQAYVDAKDNLKQDLLNSSGANANITKDDTGTTAASRVVTNVTADGQGHVTVVTAPIDVGGDISTAINALDGTVVANDSGTIVKNVTQTDGVITVEHGTVGTNDIDNSAVTNAKIADGAVTMPKTSFTMPQGDSNASWLAAIDETTSTSNYGGKDVLGATWNQQEGKLQAANEQADNYVPTMGAVNALIVKQSEAEDEAKSWAVDNNGTLFTKYKNAGDSYVPTVAAVEKRVQQAEASAGSNLTSAADDTASASVSGTNTTLTIATAGQAGNKTDKFATSHAVATGFTAVNTAIGNMALDAQTGAGVVKSVSQADGKIAVSRSTVATDDIADSAVTHAKLADDAVEGNNVKNHSLQYKDEMDFKLSEINTPGGNGSAGCVIGSPCVLTMVMSGGAPVYEWTNMDTDNTNAVLGPAS